MWEKDTNIYIPLAFNPIGDSCVGFYLIYGPFLILDLLG